ncbi:hypothetical protein A0U91_03445 [Acetobacter persici]|uniref:Uncharacterized protein n=1 Tax=Acetobacter persici TaxID=1076596 RepID=A0A1U9LCL6_9PROT|nr:hypothetical protein A0U91_03445 [Acetobacter persici]
MLWLLRSAFVSGAGSSSSSSSSSRLKAQGSRLKAQGSRLKAQGSRLKKILEKQIPIIKKPPSFRTGVFFKLWMDLFIE